jgi:spore germination cell wall hydrolase CwlJ-like protein
LEVKIPLVFVVLLCFAAPATAQQVDPRLQTCIAHIVYGEARNEPIKGQYWVAWSLVFRALANRRDFGGSDICDVAYKTTVQRRGYVRYQYDGAKIIPKDDPAGEVASYVAQMTLLGYEQPEVPVMYFCSVHVRDACQWHDKATHYVDRVGGHEFYLDPEFPALMEASASW